MDNSRTAFSDSNDISGSSSICCIGGGMTESFSPETSPAEITSLKRLSETLESIFDAASPEFDYFADAKLVIPGAGKEIPVHRCILSARSPFFKNLFCGKKDKNNSKVELKEVMKEYEVSYDAVVSVLAYLYSGKIRPSPKDVCVCVDNDCSHVACRPAVAFLVEILYTSFTFQISELVDKFQRHLLDILDKTAADDVMVVLSVANICGKACERLLSSCIEIIVKSNVDIITLDKALPHDIVKQITNSRAELGLQGPESNGFPDKHVKRIHRALDSDDVELLQMLLREGHTTLDDAFALHYAVAYCDAKTTAELLDLALADINHQNSRGYTVLHVAAMRKEPKIIVSLLTKGARPSDLTSDGRKALQIAKRLTRLVDFSKTPEEGKSASKDRLCIEILEQAERRDPLLGEASVSLAMAGDDLRMKLLYLENRVGLAKLLFPMEAKVAMDIAQVDGTSEFPLASISKKMVNAQRTTVDLNEVPFRIKEEHLNRLRALSRTVELGKRFFPRCSEVLNKIMDADDLSEIAYMGNDTAEERQLKKQRYMELQEILTKAFTEDKEEFDKTNNISSSCSSTSKGVDKPNKLPFRK
ncbi:PREDICTED: BTB/POZ domain and ankyrin repeat-containing protein NPR1 [Nicotiana attenuata]|uniref:Regulatory protein npr1 n=2 Tax=Nicotiana attenuata TaxID=49451 RepID=A0A314L7H7_NICAT|nr:PREDICTED: BTB/POZ domain and ankyrin repeat-containing protein NPR1 [Nicotiana attenuata]OIT37731.1 regulatory protein npr1 [Nicotiana attenuata]